jgi:rod shape-determining protein MreD
MAFTAARTLEPWQWLGVPAVACVLGAVVFAIPTKILGLVHLPEPVLPLVPAFAWAVIRPSVLAPLVLLALGLFMDLLWGTPMGLWAISILVGYGVILISRNMLTGQSGAVLWIWYGGMVALAMAVGYLLTVMNGGSAPHLWPVFWQFLPTVLLYPFVHRLIEQFEDADVRFR